MSIVVVKRIDNKIVMCSDSASFVGDRKHSDDQKKIHKITDNIYIGATGDVSSINLIVDMFSGYYDKDIEPGDGDIEISDIPDRNELMGMILSLLTQIRENKWFTDGTNVSMIFVVGNNVYSVAITKDNHFIQEVSDSVLNRGYAVGMYTENIRLLLDTMHPRDVIKAIYNDGGIYINDVIQEVVIWDSKRYCQAT